MQYICESERLAISKPMIFNYLKGNGVDLGAGHHKIRPESLGIDFGGCGHSWEGDVTQLFWFRDNVLDYVFSSHCLEHVIDDEATLREWVRALKPGGHLVLYVPDDDVFDNSAMLKTGEHKRVYTQATLRDLLLKNKSLSIVTTCKDTGFVQTRDGKRQVYSLLAICRKN